MDLCMIRLFFFFFEKRMKSILIGFGFIFKECNSITIDSGYTHLKNNKNRGR